MRYSSFPKLTTLPAYLLSSLLCALTGFGFLASLGTVLSWEIFEPGLGVLLAVWGASVLALLPTYQAVKAEGMKPGASQHQNRGTFESWLPATPLEALAALLLYGFALVGSCYLVASAADANFTWLTVIVSLAAALPVAAIGLNRHLTGQRNDEYQMQ